MEGWPPDVSRNLSLYLKPGLETAIIRPTKSVISSNVIKPDTQNNVIKWRGVNYYPNYILICVHSAPSSIQRRALIRKTWAKGQTNLPIKVFFIIGINQSTSSKDLRDESERFGDILQENFVDSYNNLTLKSMFMLKYSQTLDKKVKYLMKVDDDSYVNLKRLMDYMTIIQKRCSEKCILGHVLGPGSPVNRPNYSDIAKQNRQFTEKWEVPGYIYQNDVFPNAVSGSGYVITTDAINCVYNAGLKTSFLNLEDVFITGLAAAQCQIILRNSQWFAYMGKRTKFVKKQDILIHGLKKDTELMEVYKRLQILYN